MIHNKIKSHAGLHELHYQSVGRSGPVVRWIRSVVFVVVTTLPFIIVVTER